MTAPPAGPAHARPRVRPFTEADWATFAPVFREVVEGGETYMLPIDADPREVWTAEHVVVAEDERGGLLGSAKMGANRPAQGRHLANASFMVGSAARGLGVGRALGEYVVAWAARQGFRGIVFNAVVSSNTPAVRLWSSLGFEIVGTVPGAFRRPSGEHVGVHVMHLDLSTRPLPGR